MPKILILRFSSIGDIVLTTPVMRNLKLQLDGAVIHYCTKPAFQGLLENNPYVDKIFTLSGGLSELVAQLREEKYDYILDLHHNLRTLAIKTLLWLDHPKVKIHSFDKLNFEKWLYVNFKINRMPKVHIVDRYLDTTKSLGIKPDRFGLDYFIPHKDEVEIEWLPETHQKGYVAYAMGAQHNTKKLPFERMIELCEKINRPIVLLGDKKDGEVGEKIAAYFENKNKTSQIDRLLQPHENRTLIYNACGKFNLNQSASLVRQAKVVFTHDTGLMHIAAAFKKTIYSIWGNTTPALGMYPYRTRYVVLENNHLRCRPCSKIGYSKCPKGHFKCMYDIKFDFYIP